ncbi:MAG: ABC transporter substrate-binding protein [Coriobacteriia bacterium]
MKVYQDMYNDKVDYQLAPGTYETVAETKLIGGEQIDVIYVHTDQLNRWLKAGWIRSIEDLPGAQDLKKGLYPSNVQDLSGLDGKLSALPYYTGYRSFMYDAEKLDRANLKPPETWDELVDQCRQLKAKKISQYPFIGYWISNVYTSWSWFSMWYSEGEPVFNDKLEPTFQDSEVFKKIWQVMKTMFDEQLVPPDILTIKDHVMTFGTGEHVFLHHSNYIQQSVNNPKQSKVAGNVKNAMMPGKTHETLAWTEGFALNPKATDLDRAWQLVQFLGGKDKKGEFYVPKQWALQAGLGSAYKEVMDDKEIVAAFSKWTDLNIWKQQQEKSRSRAASKALWYPEWNLSLINSGQDFLLGKTPLDKLITGLYNQVVDLKKKYPS